MQNRAAEASTRSIQPAIELLAPAGDWDCARAAVENGADAIYFGLDVGFNARARATNFHIEDLPKLMAMLHRQAVRGYVTLNTLVFTDELSRLEEHVRQLVHAGVDAVLVQDLGVARLLRQLCPELEVHASTQMTITSAAAIRMAAELGVRRVVLARELSIKEIRSIAAESVLPLEAFVHGALCVAYSGQCLTSESFGGRSANRGQCAQACRLPYDLVCDGQDRDLGNQKYLLSPQDLAAYDLIPDLIDAGITSMKIEGRLKTPEYVANICQHYRIAIDQAIAGQPQRLNEQDKREMELSFSRGFSPGWLEGCDHKRLVPGRSSAKRGVLLGSIESIRGDAFVIHSSVPLSIGDGIVLEGDRLAGKEIGGRIYELTQSGRKIETAVPGRVEVHMQRGTFTGRNSSGSQTASRQSPAKFNAGRYAKNDRAQSSADEPLVGKSVWKTDDPRLARRLRQSFESADARKRVTIDATVTAAVGTPLEVSAVCHDGVSVRVLSEQPAEQARKHALDAVTLQEQLSRLGGSVYQLGELTCHIEGQPMLPLSVLGSVRKALIQALDEARTVVQARACAAANVTSTLLDAISDGDQETSDSDGDSQLVLLCRSLTQVRQVLECGVREVIIDLHDLREYAEAVRLAREVGARSWAATLRIHKPGEDGLFRMIEKCGADGWLARSLAAIDYARRREIPFLADFSLNVANPVTAEQIMHWGARRFTVSYDLNRAQLMQLASIVPSHWMEVVIHQHMPMFHMEHCVFCSVLSPGKNKSDCGRPCDSHDVKLRDRVGMEHVLHADIGCRNTLYNAQAQSGAEIVKDLLQLGLRSFRIELLRDAPAAEVQNLITLYRELLAGARTGSEVWKNLQADNRVGVTRGTLDGPKNPLAIL